MAEADGENAITLSWTAPSDAGSGNISAYRVERSVHGAAPWELLSSSVRNTTYRDATGLYRGMTRYYRVAARNSAGWGEWSMPVEGTTAGNPASAPGWVGLLRFTAVGSDSVTLAWAAPSDDGGAPVTKYRYQVMRPDGSADAPGETIGTSKRITGLKAAGGYMFQVWAVNAAGDGPAESLSVDLKPSASGSISVSTTSLTVNEGGSASYTVRPSSNPPGPVMLNLGTPGMTGQQIDEWLHRVAFTPSGWEKPEGCKALDGYTIQAWNQAVRVELTIANDDETTGDEVGLFTHSVFPAPAECWADGTDWSGSAYDPSRRGPDVLVTRKDND